MGRPDPPGRRSRLPLWPGGPSTSLIYLPPAGFAIFRPSRRDSSGEAKDAVGTKTAFGNWTPKLALPRPQAEAPAAAHSGGPKPETPPAAYNWQANKDS